MGCVLTIWSDDLCNCVATVVNYRSLHLRPGVGHIRCNIPNVRLFPGQYFLKVSIGKEQPQQVLALRGWFDAAVPFVVHPTDVGAGTALVTVRCHFHLEASWESSVS